MNDSYSLEEDIRHGSKERPILFLRFSPQITGRQAEPYLVERHWHHWIEILHIKKGTFVVEFNLEKFELQTGDLCFVNSGELHRIEAKGTDTAHDVVIFDPRILDFSYHDAMQDGLIEPLLTHAEVLPHIVRAKDEGYGTLLCLYEQISDSKELETFSERFGRTGRLEELSLEGYTGDLRNLYKRLGDTEQGKEWYVHSKLVLYQMLYMLKKLRRMRISENVLTAVEKEKVDRYKRVAFYIQEHFSEHIVLERLAEEANCTPQHLCAFFKEITGVPPIQYLIGYRVERARMMLRDTTKSVTEICFDCGFENVSYFIRRFKQLTGMTPGEYRKAKT